MAVEPILASQLQPPKATRNSVRRLAGNAVSILASDAANRATTFLLYLLIARYVGAFEYGQFSLGLTFFQTFQLLAIGGMKILITREVARDKEKAGLYLVNGSAVVVLLSAVSFTLMALLARVLQYAPDTAGAILWLSLGLMPYALATVADALFQARERMQYITYANVLVNGFKVGLGFLVLSRGYGLSAVVILLFGAHVVAMGIKWGFLVRYVVRPRIKIDVGFCRNMLNSTATFLGIDGLIAILSSFNVILLSKLAGELEVGLFNAANQLLVPMALVFESILIGAFPRMCQSYEPSLRGLKRISERLLELLLAMVVPVAVGLFALAGPILLLLYGDEGFLPAASALCILVGALVTRVFTQVLGRVLLASLQEKKTLRILAVDVLASVILGPILISRHGLMGAALTSLLVQVVDLVQHYVPVSRMFSGIPVGSLIWRPVAASAVMAIYLFAGPEHNLFVTIALAAAIYGVTIFTLAAWTAGGFRQLKARYLDFT
jgi:O-antigen/teichoic acid export membrane protein